MTLRWLDGGSHLDIKDVFLVSTAEFGATKLRMINAINEAYPVELPASHDEQREIANKFEIKSKFRCMQGCVGAVDGCIFTINNPGKEVDDSHSLRQLATPTVAVFSLTSRSPAQLMI